MDTETVYTIIHHIDNQLSKVKLDKANQSAVNHLFELRNNIILTYRPDPQYDWSFKNKRLLEYFSRETKWIIP
jgi:hypothetical protein